MLRRLLPLAFLPLLFACNAIDGPTLEITERRANEIFVGFFDYAIEVHCTVYNSGEKGGTAKVTATYLGSVGEFEESASGGVASGDYRTFSFTFEEAVVDFSTYQYNCRLN